MAHLFVILKDGKQQSFSNYEDIPQSFDNVIRFEPEIPEGPHTDEQHEEIDQWNDRLQDLLKRETNGC
mgnify:CR=1 FL=1